MIKFDTDKKILITSALPYANNIPHLGNIIGCVLSGDVFARFCRNKYGKDRVLYVCGTDEHGTTTETKAVELGITPDEVCSKFNKIHKEIYDWFGCSFDVFGRTSSQNNHKITQEIFKKLDDNGFIIEQEVKQLYCEKCNKFLADRFVEGSCPKCGYEDARGDQCDKCSSLLDATDLINPRCKVCNSTPVVKVETHLFIDLTNPKLQENLKSWMEAASVQGNWSQNAKTMSESWLRDGLKPRCITRSLKWGVPVPKEGYENKVFYSWFDAPIGYVGITKDLIADETEFKSWWNNPENVNLYQFMGKDNIPFHTILFPSFLIGAQDNYTLLHQISSTEYLNYEDSKFSKSRGVGVFGDDAMKTGIGADVFRYVLLSNRPESSDTVFTWKGFQEKNNNELLANLGNFVNRGLVFLDRTLGGVVPKITPESESEDVVKFKQDVGEKIKLVIGSLEKIELRKAINEIMLVSKLGNEFFQHREPWKHKSDSQDDKDHLNTTVYYCVDLVRKLAILIEPYLPNTSKLIFEQLNLEIQNYDSLFDVNACLKEGHKIGKPSVLFKKLEDKEIEQFQIQFSGQNKDNSDNKKAQKEKSKSKKKVEIVEPVEFKDLDLRVAKIVDIEKHPKADKLYIETLDLGTERRKIVSGLVPYYTPAELRGKKIIVVCNLKPAKLRGVESFGMLLAAEDEDNKDNVGVVLAPNSKLGEQVYLDGTCATNPEEFKELSIDQFFTIEFESTKEGVVFNGTKLRTATEELSVDKEIVGKIR